MKANIIELVERLISTAREVQYQAMEGPQQCYEDVLEDLENAKSNLLKAINDYTPAKD